jgi:endonuclease YncB( thermonuclease family)
MNVRVRLIGVNTPERGHPDWTTATSTTRDWCEAVDADWPLRVSTAKTEKYGRWLADVVDLNGRSLNQHLVKSGWGT